MDASPAPLPGRRYGSLVAKFPFTLLDEILHHYDRPDEPQTVQIELEVPGRLDGERVRRAVDVAVSRHLLAQVCKLRPRIGLIPAEWTTSTDLAVHTSTAAAADDIRAEFYSTPIPLDRPPPVRVVVVPDDDHSRVLLSANHSAFDGMSCVRFLASVARAYAGDPDPGPLIDERDARDLPAVLGTSELTAADEWQGLTDLLQPSTALPARGRNAPGYQFALRRLSPDQTAAVRTRKDAGATVNDVLLAAAHLTVGRWLERDGEHAPKVTVTAPVNLRPPEWSEDVIGNYSTQMVTSSSDLRTNPEDALATVVTQTRDQKNSRSAWAAFDRAVLTNSLPLLLGLGAAAPPDTMLLSNLGRLETTFDFGPGLSATELWFSPPCFMPMGIAIGIGTTIGADPAATLLTFRARAALFGQPLTDKFADAYVEALHDVTSP